MRGKFLFLALVAFVLGCGSMVPSVNAAKTYDYVVVGGGTAGCVVAARLSENPKNKVLLIEAGHDNTEQPGEYTGTEPVIFPGKQFVDIQGPNIIPMRSRESAPGAYTPNHYIPISRTLGGGSSTNGQCYSRLGAEDFEYFDIPGWSYDEVAPFQRKVESYHPFSSSHASAARGSSGPVSVTTYQPGDLSANIIQTMSRVLGLPIKDDLDSGDAKGVSQFGRNSKPDAYTRESSWVAYLKPFAARPNLEIQMDAVVTSIEWKTERVRGVTQAVQPLEAEGVYFTIDSTPEGETAFVKVRKELILAAGAINTPKLLMLSGVGPAEHLVKKGVEVMLPFDQVGKNLQDHMSLPMMSWIYRDPAVSDRVLPVAFGRTGLRPDKYLDYELAYVQVANGVPLSPTLKGAVVGALPVLTRNSANGLVQLLDKNPRSHPLVDFKAFQDPLDTTAMAWLANTTRAIAMATPGFITERAPGFGVVPLNAPLSAWNAFIQNTGAFSGAKSYAHFVGTCRMARSKETGVVDSRLRMFGSANVRIADMSVIPRTVSQRPFATAMLVGERAADFILADQK